MLLVLGGFAWAGPEHVQRVHARHEAREIELLQRTTCRVGVPEQAVARYLDRFSALDTRPVRRIEAWGAALQPPVPEVPTFEDPVVLPALDPSASTPSQPAGIPQ